MMTSAFTRAARLLPAVAIAVLAVGAVARQTWRADAVTSFDEIWQTIHDTFPDPDFGGVAWADVRTELRPKVENAASADAARDVMREMLARLHRSHFVLLSAASPADTLSGPAMVPIDVRVAGGWVVVTRVVGGSTASRAGVTPGMILESVDGTRTASWLAAAEGGDARARDVDAWRRVYRGLHGPTGSTAVLRLATPAGAGREVRVARTDEAGDVIQFGNLPPLHVAVDVREEKTPVGRRAGFIGFNIWMPLINARVDAAVDRFRGDAALIFDLRGNPGGLAAMMSGISGYVLSTDAVLGTMRTRETFDNPLTFRANPRLVTDDGRRVVPFAGPVAILVDELTASTSECFAGGLQSLGRARVFGRRTSGMALPASTKRLANGDVLMYAIGDFVTSTGRRLEGEGVVPDEVQPLDPAALAAGRDLALEAALRWVDAAVGRGGGGGTAR